MFSGSDRNILKSRIVLIQLIFIVLKQNRHIFTDRFLQTILLPGRNFRWVYYIVFVNAEGSKLYMISYYDYDFAPWTLEIIDL